jgi:hypothetical protein
MTDYYTILYPAIAALDPNERQKRANIYDRARQIIADRGKAADNALTTTDLLKELYSLETAIRRIESELSQPNSAGTEPTPDTKPATRPKKEEARDDRPPPRLRLILRLAVIGLIVGAISIGGVVGFRHWAEKSTDRSRFRESPQPQRELVTARDGAQRIDELPYTLRRQLVYYRTTYPLGTLIISKSQKFLYLVRPNVAALRYSIGVGRKCVETAGLYRVSAKEKWPGWNDAMRSGAASTSQTENPLGAGALHLEDENHRIHGISKTIGFGSALGCFQLINDDIVDLLDRVPVGTRVVAMN